MRYLRTNTDTRVTVGPFLDKTDGITPEVALTVTSEKLTLVVDTAGVPTLILDTAPTASGGANDMAHITNDDAGYYDLELAAANVNYLGRAMLSLNDVATHCPVFHEFTILSAQVYDSLFGADVLQVHAVEITNGLITAAAVADGAIDAATFAANAINAAALDPDVTTELQSGLATAAALDAVDNFLDTEIAAILADTNELQVDWVNGGRLDLILDIIAADTTTDIPALIAALNNLSAAQVNAEVVNALNVDTYTEIGQEAPAATQTIRKMLGYLYKTWRNNKTQTSTTRKLFADDGTTVDQKATDSDDTVTFTKGEMGTGP